MMDYKRGHTFVLTILLILDIVKRRLLIRVTRVYIEGQIMSKFEVPGEKEHTKEGKLVPWSSTENEMLQFTDLSYIHHGSMLTEMHGGEQGG